MSLLYACTSCSEDMILRPTHRGHVVPCPACETDVQIPDGIGFRALTDAAVADRRRGHRVLLAAFITAIVWLPPGPAFLWWYSAGLAKNARIEGRYEVEELRSARLLSMVATVAQLIFYLHLGFGGRTNTGPLGWYWAL